MMFCIIAFMSQLYSQSKPYNIVFDLTTSDTSTHQRLIRWAKNIKEAHPDATIEIVFYGKSLDMVVKNQSTVSGDVIKLATSKQVIFAVCEQAMKIHLIEKNQLLSGVTTVPDGLYELVTKQAEGFGYIKVVN
jgi:intracellular sulfur oxidation DsrE/DsrF family protein